VILKALRTIVDGVTCLLVWRHEDFVIRAMFGDLSEVRLRFRFADLSCDLSDEFDLVKRRKRWKTDWRTMNKPRGNGWKRRSECGVIESGKDGAIAWNDER